MHMNIDGALESVASWSSNEIRDMDSALWTDANNDGWLDLLFTGCNTDTVIYQNNEGVLSTSITWRTTDNSRQFAIMATSGDVDKDGHNGLFVTDNTQLFGGRGYFRRYNGLSNGYYTQTPTWDFYEGYGSAIALADVDGDDDLDLMTGGWWEPTRLFLNSNGQFGSSQDWRSARTSVIEKIVFGQVDPPCGVRRFGTKVFQGNGERQLFHLPHQPVDAIVSVRLDGIELDPSYYTFHREQAWITVFAPPERSLVVKYEFTPLPDMAVSNWDSDDGNYLYYNQQFEDCNDNGIADGCDIAGGTSQDVNGNGKPDECERFQGGDARNVNADRVQKIRKP